MVDSVTSTSTAAQSVASAAATASSEARITSDFDTFLKLLTTQLNNQDPLKPLDSNQFAEQLATFSSVEQQTNTNKKLDLLIAQGANGSLNELAQWVGRGVRSEVAGFEYSGAEFQITAPGDSEAERAQVVIRNASGVEVARLDSTPAGGPLSWDGVGANGATVANGVYSVEFVYEKGQGASAESWSVAAGASGRVIEARRDGDAIQLLLDSGAVVDPENVVAISDSEAATA